MAGLKFLLRRPLSGTQIRGSSAKGVASIEHSMPLASFLRRFAGHALAVSLSLCAVATAAAQVVSPADGGAFDRYADQLERGEVVITTHADALKDLEKLRQQVPPGDTRRELRYRYLYCFLGIDNDPAGAKAYAERGIEDARRAGYADAEVNFHYCRGSSQSALTTPRDALPDFNVGIAIARKEENERLVADGLTWRGGVQSLLGEHALALVDFLDAQKFYDSAGVPVESEQNLSNIATAYRRLGERPEARRYLDRLMQFGIQRHDLGQQLSAHMQLGFLDIEADDPNRGGARRHFLEAMRIADSLDSAVNRASALLGLAQVDNMDGDFRGAQVNLARAEAQLKISGDQSNGDMIALQEG
ncbi:MAG: hypothetical protein KGN77_17075, partial [Xanthomonadaceae bacterium]|nr:hypothetical protein [Xanthomonadaceae bacterium]